MAEALSEQLNEKISITTSLQDGGTLDTYSNPFVSVSESQWTEFVLPADTAVQEQVPEFSHLQHLRCVLDEIKNIPSRSATTPSATGTSNEEIDWAEVLELHLSQKKIRESLKLEWWRSNGPEVNWEEYEIQESKQNRSPCSSYGSFASLTSNQSFDMNLSFI